MPRTPSRGGAHVALLRAINVGGRNPLPMAELAGIFEAQGCRDVRTYIQSGNVLFRAEPRVLKQLPRSVPAAIEDRFGFAAPVVLRSSAELGRVASAHRLAGRGVDEKALFVAFLSARPDAVKVAALDPRRSPGDVFEVHGSEIYLRFGATGGAARTRLTVDWFDRMLGVVTTVRNWRTTCTLAELARD